ALRYRDRTGEGQVIDLALYDPIFRALDEIAPRYAYDGTVRGPQGVMTSVACPHGHFECADGKWIALACTNDKMFARLAEVMERPELADEDKYATTQQRLADREAVDGLVSRWLQERPRQEVMTALVGGQVPAAPINTIADIFADPHFAARETLIERQDPELGPLTIPNVVPRLSKSPGQINSLGPRLGEANSDIYKDRLGLSEADLEMLAKKGVI
ncbi:MAG: CoA transferase, partial [Alphaproteobacteria bacterium]|nr:CoA transferase [Alphaproteobacteria bacterium]